MTVERERTEQDVHEVRCRATHEACTAVRQDFEASLEAARVVPQEAAMAALGMGELLSNAVRHGSALDDGTLLVRWTMADDRVRVAVTDAGSASSLSARLPDAAATSGRGLWMIDQISSDWGVDTSDGTEVWALFPAPRRG